MEKRRGLVGFEVNGLVANEDNGIYLLLDRYLSHF